MEEQLWKVCPACSDVPVEGCESMTLEQAQAWVQENKVELEEPAECGDTVNYVYMPVEHKIIK